MVEKTMTKVQRFIKFIGELEERTKEAVAKGEFGIPVIEISKIWMNYFDTTPASISSLLVKLRIIDRIKIGGKSFFRAR